MNKFKLLTLAAIFLSAYSALAAPTVFQTDTAKLGRPNSNNKDFIFELNLGAANPRIRANGSTNVLQISNDGSTFINLGATSGINPTITQTAHGFTVGQWLYYNGTSYALAQANSFSTSVVVGVVASVIDANNFTLLTVGQIAGLSSLTPGTLYYLSTSVAGALQPTAPGTVGQIIKPVLISVSATAGFVVQAPGIAVVAGGGTAHVTTYSSAGTNTYTTQSSASVLTICGCGPGGSGTNAIDPSHGGGGGSSGVWGCSTVPVSASTGYTVTVSGGGSGSVTTFGALVAWKAGQNGSGSTGGAIQGINATPGGQASGGGSTGGYFGFGVAGATGNGGNGGAAGWGGGGGGAPPGHGGNGGDITSGPGAAGGSCSGGGGGGFGASGTGGVGGDGWMQIIEIY